ncbi:MAG: hypothetical protein QE271_06895 [Bacteriovoracaceae bacterium]|nr:hypothetical protein [Bacteriovoracaceae bacterium]
MNFKILFFISFFFFVGCGVKKSPTPPLKNFIKSTDAEWIEKSNSLNPPPTSTPTPTSTSTSTSTSSATADDHENNETQSSSGHR